jgi:RNA polymerase subunit RPABC4/transcription elongation factor Spt4
MKRFIVLAVGLILVGCSTTDLVDNWKNPEIDSYQSYKVLIAGMTSNIEARQKFEKQLKEEYEARGVEAVMSLELFDPSFRTEKMTEDELKVLENDLINDGFDTVLFTKVIGVEDKIMYKINYDGYDETYRKFKEDYLMNQDIFYNPDYYEEYTVFHAETSMYCICPTKDRELIWKGYIDIIDPESIDETVNDYVRLVIAVLEEQQLINSRMEVKTPKEVEATPTIKAEHLFSF